MRSINTQRLHLIPVTPENADELWEVLQQPGLRDFQDLPDVDRAQFRRNVAARPRALRPGTWGRFEWLLYIDDVAKAVGWASLRIPERTTTSGEVGYSVIEGYRGRGIATEALRAVVHEAFDNLSLRRVRAYCMPDNAPSRAVLRNVGFVEDGTLPKGATVQGRPVDVIGYVLNRPIES